MHHNRTCEFGYIQAKEKKLIFYIDSLAIRLFPFAVPRLQRQVEKERDIPLSRNSSSVPGVPTRRSTGDSRTDFKILCGKHKGHATIMARQRQIKSHKLQVGIPVPHDLPAFFLLLKELNETVHCGLITLRLSAKESTR